MHWLIIILISLSLACSKKEAPAPAEPEQAAETETPASDDGAEPTADPAEELPEELKGDTPVVGAPPVVKVLEPGKEPRQPLRWNIKHGVEQRLSVDIGETVDTVIAVMRFGQPNQVVSYDLTMRATKVEEDGTVRVTFTIDDATIGTVGVPEQVGRAKRALRPMREVTGSYVLGARGHATAVEVKALDAKAIGPGLIDNLRWALIQMIPAFPTEPVGQGAKWTVHAGIEQGGVQVNQLTTTEIVKLDESRVELALTVQQSAAPQAFLNPSTQRMLRLTSLNGEATGSLSWDLNELSPRTVNMDARAIKGAQPLDSKPVAIIIQTDRTIRVTEK